MHEAGRSINRVVIVATDTVTFQVSAFPCGSCLRGSEGEGCWRLRVCPI